MAQDAFYRTGLGGAFIGRPFTLPEGPYTRSVRKLPLIVCLHFLGLFYLAETADHINRRKIFSADKVEAYAIPCLRMS